MPEPRGMRLLEAKLAMDHEPTRRDEPPRSPTGTTGRFWVRAGSVNQVRRALRRAPGGARVVGRYDRETIECSHTMDEHSYARHWSIIVSRLAKEGLRVVPRPGSDV